MAPRKQPRPPVEIAIDCETTGLSDDDRIVSLAVISTHDETGESETFYWEFNPGQASHPRAVAKHGLADDVLATKPLFSTVARDVRSLITTSRVVIAHNLAFDLKMLNRELVAAGLDPVEVNGMCTMEMARALYPGQPASLDSVARRFGMSRSSQIHSAVEDAKLARALYQKLIMIELLGYEPAETTPVATPAAPPPRRSALRTAAVWTGIVAVGLGTLQVLFGGVKRPPR